MPPHPIDIARHPSSIKITWLSLYLLPVDKALPGPDVEGEVVFNLVEPAGRVCVCPYPRLYAV